MIRGLYIAVSGMVVGEAKQGVITNNIANANTVGYKQDSLNVKNFGDVLISNYDKVKNGQNVRQDLGMLSKGSAINNVSTYFTQGVHQLTDRNTDMAIQGRGFFNIERNGNTYYSRDGHFNINQDGYLVNDMGDFVKGYNLYTGNLEKINLDSGDIHLSSEGNISVNGVERYRLEISDFPNYESLKKVGDNLYEGENPSTVTNAVVKQKYIEKSNVNVVKETVEMMNNSRSFETNQRLVQVIDETLGKAVNEVGRL
ncbi:flagellar basal-body rod protein FlgG [Hathewaya proteolytica DSM 3090]|uniref:Flagellar basal-body rod protein FlgG n=1 Tax=Hathewaya proteolytica DSM 3090 TaxID=1121331 RepID=A0A1M6L8P8_9CLOT|nr:flagellar hook-basal body complex protein [Hathewaya proteolytica]SHJ67576.1 flagellar basal-body rod protein FlgG [Hathewaya proteolytica DSM 3090]